MFVYIEDEVAKVVLLHYAYEMTTQLSLRRS